MPESQNMTDFNLARPIIKQGDRLFLKREETDAKGKGYYAQLLEDFKILDFMETYKTDFTFHDKQYFDVAGDTFPFILGLRKTGTNMEDLVQTQQILHEDHKELKLIEEHFKYSLMGYNQRWFFGNKGKIREISREEAEKTFRQYVDEAMAWEPISEPTKIWITSKFNLWKAIKSHLWDHVEDLQYGTKRIDETLEEYLLNLYIQAVYQKDLQSKFTPAQQREMQAILAHDPDFSKTMAKLLPSAKILKEIVPMLKPAVEVSGDGAVGIEWIVEERSPTTISLRASHKTGEKMEYLIFSKPNGTTLLGIHPNGLLRMFDEPKKRKNQKFTNPMVFTPESLAETLKAEGIPAEIITKRIFPILIPPPQLYAAAQAQRKIKNNLQRFIEDEMQATGEYAEYAKLAKEAFLIHLSEVFGTISR